MFRENIFNDAVMRSWPLLFLLINIQLSVLQVCYHRPGYVRLVFW